MTEPTIQECQRNSSKLLALCETQHRIEGTAMWQPARPLCQPSIRERLRGAWLCLTGRATYVRWYR